LDGEWCRKPYDMMHGKNVLKKEWGEYIQGIVLFNIFVLYIIRIFTQHTSSLTPPPMLSS
jgi:hypothetical protein